MNAGLNRVKETSGDVDELLLIFSQKNASRTDGICMRSKSRMKELRNDKISNERRAENESSSYVKPTREGSQRKNSMSAVDQKDQIDVRVTRLIARDAPSDQIGMRHSSMHVIRTVRHPMHRRQRSKSFSRSASIKKLTSNRKLLSQASCAQRIEKGSTTKRKMHKQRSEHSLSSHHISDDTDVQNANRASSPKAITTEPCETGCNRKLSGEGKDTSRPNFGKQLSDAFSKSCNGLKESLHKRIPIQQGLRSSKDKGNSGRSQLAFRKQSSESSFDANDKQKQQHMSGSSKPIRNLQPAIPKSMLEQKLHLAWRKENALPCDDESAVAEYM